MKRLSATTLLLFSCATSSNVPLDGSAPGADAQVDAPSGGGSVPGADATTPDDAGPPVDAGAAQVSMVDLLFVIDNSGSMQEEQTSLKSELPALIEALSSGTRADGGRFPLIQDLRVGIVSSDMGTGGFTIPTCNEPNFGDDGILLRDSDCGVDAAGPPFLGLVPGVDPEDFASDLQCLASLGTQGCGFEQPLDAMIKAVLPQSNRTSFVNGSRGHGDGANEFFLREESLLVVVVLTDEDDCSASNPDIFNRDSAVFTDPDLNLRCSRYGDPSIGAVHPTSRFVDALLSVHPPERLVYHVVAGLPVDLAPPPGESPDYSLLIGEERVRDARMIERPDPEFPSQLSPSCQVPGRGNAYPPLRLLRVAQGLEQEGVSVEVQSICQEGLGLSAALTRRISRHL